ncbi:MAG: YraN family protein [Chromatiales bacterium]|nr:YraN family protein [Chromatiales bacterium]
MKAEAGKLAEEAGLAYLQARGLHLLECNFRCRAGEIDIVMRESETLVFVEVRYRRSDYFGGPAASVAARKQQRLIKAAEYYLYTHPAMHRLAARFDVIAVRPGTPLHIEWIADAFRP